MAIIQVYVWKRGPGDKMIKTSVTLMLQQILFLSLEDKFYRLKEILPQNLIFIEDQLT